MLMRIQYDYPTGFLKLFVNNKLERSLKIGNIYENCPACIFTNLFKAHPPYIDFGSTTLYNYTLSRQEVYEHTRETVNLMPTRQAPGYTCHFGMTDKKESAELTSIAEVTCTDYLAACAAACTTAGDACMSYTTGSMYKGDYICHCYLHKFAKIDHRQFESPVLMKELNDYPKRFLLTTCIKEAPTVSGFKSHVGLQPYTASTLSAQTVNSTDACAAICRADTICRGFQISWLLKTAASGVYFCSTYEYFSVYSNVDYNLRENTPSKRYLTTHAYGYREDTGLCPSGRFGPKCDSVTRCAGQILADTNSSLPLCPSESCEPGWFGEACQSQETNIVGQFTAELLQTIKVHGALSTPDSTVRCLHLTQTDLVMAQLDYSWQPAMVREFTIIGWDMSCGASSQDGFHTVVRFGVRENVLHSTRRQHDEKLSFCETRVDSHKICMFRCVTLAPISQYFLYIENPGRNLEICSVFGRAIF